MKFELEFDGHAFGFVARFAILLGVIFFAGSFAGRQLSAYMFPLQNPDYQILPRQEPSGPVFRELSDDAVIFSSGDAVLSRKDELLQAKRDFIFADLSAMTLAIYQDGEHIKTFEIRGKGKDGTFFETPNGSYKIRLKEKKHFSTIGKVWMPWSMLFFGNYFIHGIPYYPDGTYVSDAFSGGCIRLSVEDAKELFSLTKEGIVVLTYFADPEKDLAFAYYQKIMRPPVTPPALSAIAFIAADFETGQILFEKDRSRQFPIASVSKLMTGLVALETINRFKIVPVTKHALTTEGDSAHLAEGDEYKAEELLYPLILSSSNDVATLYQQQAWNFVDAMNQKAEAVGMTATHYTEASGLSAENVSTPEDLFILLRYIYAHKKPLFVLSGLREYTLMTADKAKKISLINVNWPREDESFIGGKSGSTPEARQAMAAVYKVQFAEYGERPVAIIVLGSYDRVSDIHRIQKYLEDNFVYGNVFARRGAPGKIVEAGASVYSAISTMLDNK